MKCVTKVVLDDWSIIMFCFKVSVTFSSCCCNCKTPVGTDECTIKSMKYVFHVMSAFPISYFFI